MAEKHFIQLMSEEAPVVSKAFFDLAGAIEKDGGLDEKTFQLVYIAIKASIGEDGAVAAHAAMAKKAGASRDEVRGAVLVSLMTSGVTGVSACLGAALDSWDNA